MDKITVTKDALLAKLKENRNTHEQVYKDAVEKYKEAIVFYLKKALARAEKGKKVNHYISVVEPTNNLKDYDRVIGMLEMSTQTTIQLDSNEYSQYVLDDWNWKDTFSNSSGLYGAGRFGYSGYTGSAGSASVSGISSSSEDEELGSVFQANDINLQD